MTTLSITEKNGNSVNAQKQVLWSIMPRPLYRRDGHMLKRLSCSVMLAGPSAHLATAAKRSVQSWTKAGMAFAGVKSALRWLPAGAERSLPSNVVVKAFS